MLDMKSQLHIDPRARAGPAADEPSVASFVLCALRRSASTVAINIADFVAVWLARGRNARQQRGL
jgi:hypothetical protein